MNKVLIELILTNQCNKRCKYCDLEFKNRSISEKDIDLFIDFISNNKAEYNINFFWWEPLLEYDKIKYFVDKTKGSISKFSVWTNGLLLNKEKLEFFKNNNIRIYLSIDNIDTWKKLDLESISKYNDIVFVNFVNDPDYIDNSINVYNNIRDYGFKNIAFMPVFSSKKWNKSSLIRLKKTYNYIKENRDWINLEKYSYFNWIKVDKQFILDTDLYFYSDLDSLLWLQKQYKIVPEEMKNEIKNKTKLFSLKEKDISLNNLINLYNINEIVRLVFDIPKKMWDYLTYKVIDKILENDTKER